MAIASIRCLGFTMLMIAAILLPGNSREVSAQSCGDLKGFVSLCKTFISKLGPKVPPSAQCCALAKTVNVPCACKLVTAEIEKIISMEKFVYVGQTCGLTIPHGLKCGSYIVPMA